jgi:hypothetical protein
LPKFLKLKAAQWLKFILSMPKLMSPTKEPPIFRLPDEGLKHLSFVFWGEGRRGLLISQFHPE